MQAETAQNGPDNDQLERSPMQEIRDSFLDSILSKFPQLDANEIYEILRHFKKPFISLLQAGDGQIENSAQEPWDFSYLAINNIRSPNEVSMAEDESGEPVFMRRSTAHVDGLEVDQVEQDMRRLSLEKREKQSSSRQRMPAPSQNETDEAMVFSTGDTSMQGTGRD